MIDDNLKLCTKCNTVKSTHEFYKCKSMPDGWQQYCKACNSLSMKRYNSTSLAKETRKKNKEKNKEKPNNKRSLKKKEEVLTEHRDRKRQRDLNEQLKDGMIPSVTRAIHKELEQILVRRKQRREEEKARVKKKAFVETKCHCGNLFMRKNLKGMSATHCPECRKALNKRNVPYAKRKTQLFKCETCSNKVSHENILPHEGKQICGECYEKILDAFYKADTLERRMSERSQIGSSLDQMRQVAIGKGNDEDTFEPKRRYVKNKAGKGKV